MAAPPRSGPRPKKPRKIIKRVRSLSPADVIARSLVRTGRGHGDAGQKTLRLIGNLAAWLDPAQPAPNGPVRPDRPGGAGPTVDDRAPSQPSPADRPASPGSSAARDADSIAHFWRIWAEHQGFLRRRCLRLMAGNLADAEDALSVAMLNGCRAFSLGVIVNERAWLARLVHNACMDQYRSHRRHVVWQDGAEPKGVEPTAKLSADRPRSPEDDLMGREQIADIIVDLLSLPDTLLEPLVMRCFQDMAYSEIADALNLTNAAARKRVELARKKMRKPDAR